MIFRYGLKIILNENYLVTTMFFVIRFNCVSIFINFIDSGIKRSMYIIKIKSQPIEARNTKRFRKVAFDTIILGI